MKKTTKQNLVKVMNSLLAVVILIQAVFCFVLLYRTATNKDMALFGFRFYYIVSPSMEPTIPVGAEIVVKEVDADTLKAGDIITFESRDEAIAGYPNTHRIAAITTDEAGKKAFVTKGDNNSSEDQYLVYPEDIYGKVVVITPALKGLIMFYSFAATPIGFMVVVIMPLMVVFGVFLRSFIQEIKAGTEAAREERELAEGVSSASAVSEVQSADVINEDMALMINAIVKSYFEQNPGKELSPQEAAAFAAGLMNVMKKEGKIENADRS